MDVAVGPSSEGVFHSKCGIAFNRFKTPKKKLNFNTIDDSDDCDDSEEIEDVEDDDEHCYFRPIKKNTSRASNNNKSKRMEYIEAFVFNKASIDFLRYKPLWCDTHQVAVDLYYPSKPQNAFHYDRRDYRSVHYIFMTLRVRTDYKSKTYRPIRYIKITLSLFKSIIHRIWKGMLQL